MDGEKPTGLDDRTPGDVVVVSAASEAPPRRTRKRKHNRFIDLQKQPPKPKPLIQE